MTTHYYQLRNFRESEFKLYCTGEWERAREDGWKSFFGRSRKHQDYTSTISRVSCKSCLEKLLKRHEWIVAEIKGKI